MVLKRDVERTEHVPPRHLGYVASLQVSHTGECVYHHVIPHPPPPPLPSPGNHMKYEGRYGRDRGGGGAAGGGGG